MTAILDLIEIIAYKISNSTSEQEILFLSKIIEKLQVKIKLVATYSDMIDGNYSIGDLYFVEDENNVYYTYKNFRFRLLGGKPSAYAWGNGAAGRLGDGTITTKSSPVSVIGGYTDWVQVSAGQAHSLGVRANGTAWAWGLNTNGRLGDGTITSRSLPVSVVGGFTNWTQISAGYAHSLGLRADGTAWAWGSGANGRLGDGTTVSKSSPVSVVGGYTDWVQVSAGNIHSLGVRANGTAWGWGYNGSGRLGDGTVISRLSPVSVVGDFTDWIQVSTASANGNHSLGLRANGTAWGWGQNTNGRLGDGTITSRSSPVSVVGGFTDWIQVSAGQSHSLGVRANGTAWAWGYNANGRLGDGTTVSKTSPVSVVGGFTNWIQVAAGYHSLAIRTDGTAWAWGPATGGVLGDGTAVSKSSPVSVVGGFTDWFQVSAGGGLSLAIRTT